jgi:hypothetical protein
MNSVALANDPQRRRQETDEGFRASPTATTNTGTSTGTSTGTRTAQGSRAGQANARQMSNVGQIIEHTNTRLAAATSIITGAAQRSPAGPTARQMQEMHQITRDLETSIAGIQQANERAARDRRITGARAARDRRITGARAARDRRITDARAARDPRITDRPMTGPAAATNTGNGGALESRVAQAAARVAQALAHYEQHRSRESYAERDTRLG